MTVGCRTHSYKLGTHAYAYQKALTAARHALLDLLDSCAECVWKLSPKSYRRHTKSVPRAKAPLHRHLEGLSSPNVPTLSTNNCSIVVPYFPDYRSHSIISRTPNSVRQALCIKNCPRLDREKPACDSFVYTAYAYACLTVNFTKNPESKSHLNCKSHPIFRIWIFM